MLPAEAPRSCLPWDIPWQQPEYAIFFGIFYALVIVLGAGATLAVLKSLLELKREHGGKSGQR